MVRHAWVACTTALLLFGGLAAQGQSTNAAPNSTSDAARDTSVAECAGLGSIGMEISVGYSRPKAIKLKILGGSTCGDYTRPSDIWASTDETQVEIRGDSCPAFVTQARKLRPSRPREMRWYGHGPMPAVQVGPFRITDWAGYFELRNPKGRRAAARWVRLTLAAVRPCWEVADDKGGARLLLHRPYEDVCDPPDRSPQGQLRVEAV